MSSICKSYSHFFSKNTCELDIVLTRAVNILTTNELVKLTALWTTGHWCLRILFYLNTSTTMYKFLHFIAYFPIGDNQWAARFSFRFKRVERKAMIRNRYLPSKTRKGKKDALKATAPQSKHNKQKVKRTSSFQTIGQTAIQNANFTRTYMQRHTLTKIVNHSRNTALERTVKILHCLNSSTQNFAWAYDGAEDSDTSISSLCVFLPGFSFKNR